jgi:hypothetical protein
MVVTRKTTDKRFNAVLQNLKSVIRFVETSFIGKQVDPNVVSALKATYMPNVFVSIDQLKKLHSLSLKKKHKKVTPKLYTGSSVLFVKSVLESLISRYSDIAFFQSMKDKLDLITDQMYSSLGFDNGLYALSNFIINKVYSLLLTEIPEDRIYLEPAGISKDGKQTRPTRMAIDVNNENMSGVLRIYEEITKTLDQSKYLEVRDGKSYLELTKFSSIILTAEHKAALASLDDDEKDAKKKEQGILFPGDVNSSQVEVLEEFTSIVKKFYDAIKFVTAKDPSN